MLTSTPSVPLTQANLVSVTALGKLGCWILESC